MSQGSSGQGGGAAAGGLIGIILAGFLFLPMVNAYSAWNMLRAAQSALQIVARLVLIGALWLTGMWVFDQGYKTYQANGMTGEGYATVIFLLLKIGAAIFVAQWIVFFLTGGRWSDIAPYMTRLPGLKKQHLRGMSLVDVTRQRKPKWLADSNLIKPVALGWVPYPSLNAETLHTQLEGGTGSGKSQAIKCLAAEFLARGDNLIAVDTGHDLLETFGGVAGHVYRFDVMDNDFLPRWSPYHEIERRSDWHQLAQGLIGDGKGDSAEWRSMAKSLFAAVGMGYAQACEEEDRIFSNREFFDLLISAPPEVLEPFVRGTAAASLTNNDKGLNAIRMSLLDPLRFFEYLPEHAQQVDAFSIRKWVRETMTGPNQRSLFITYRKRDLATVRSLISAVAELAISTAIDTGKAERPTWLLIDELAGLGEIPALLTGAAELRKTNVRLVCGMQDLNQIEDLYGQNRAASICNNLTNKLFLRASDGRAAERMSLALGEQRMLVEGESQSESGSVWTGTTKTKGISRSERDERVVMPSEILSLPDLIGYVKLAGDAKVYKTPVPIFAGFYDKPEPVPASAPGGALVRMPS
ncbi:type IV secretion system DNA-binding domain-containing protein [Paracoccus nototheniae]|uniref:Type IV secretion system DNA-binding domain-containing protein n=1 Tax=Paracoccus nototheniae TaxID=2489002 RepID=A0ABW4E4V9_9RHOB|nr:type IV secretion system DNA-binding domain-containing protein [Paracoccus nototheniae]